MRTREGAVASARPFRLGDWLIEPLGGKAVLGGREVRLRPRVMDLLVYLAGRDGEVASKEEILDAVWSTRVVAESAMSGAMAELRTALGDDPAHPWLVETVPKRGYRLLVAPGPVSSAPWPPDRPPAGDAPWAEGPGALFADRRQELATLLAAFREAKAGHGRALFVVGEAGSGKTALLAELARRLLAEEPAVAVAGGKGHAPVGLGDPYLPFREALHVLHGDLVAGWLPCPSAFDVAGPAREWARILRETSLDEGPDVIGTFLPGPVPASAPTRQALFEQLSRTLRAFSLRKALVLLLDDLHWADEGSVALLFHLGRHLPGSRILLVGAYRPEELRSGAGGVRHPLSHVADELERYGGDAPIRLGAHPDRDFLDALVDAVPNRLDEDFRRQLFRLTAGQPLLTIELLRSLSSRGALARDADGRWAVAEPVDWGRLPARADALVREWVEEADETARAVLLAAAVEGEKFSAETVALALRLPAARVVSALSRESGPIRCLVQPCGVRSVHGKRSSSYRFSNGLVRRYLYDRLDAAGRAERHEAAGRALERFLGPLAGEASPTLARHFEAGARPERAVPYRLGAGDRALQLSALDEACGHYAAAAALLEANVDPPDGEGLLRRAEASRALALGLSHGSASEAAGAAWRRASGLCAAAGDERGLFFALRQLANHLGAKGAVREALDLAPSVLAAAERAGRRSDLSAALYHRGVALTQAGDLREAARSFSDACALDDGTGEPDALAHGLDPAVPAWAFWAFALLALGLPEQAASRSAATIDLAERRGHPYGVGLAHGLGAGLLRVLRREAAPALAHADETLARARAHGFPNLLALGELVRGAALAESGERDEGIRRLRRGLELLAESGHGNGRSTFLCRLAEALLASGGAAQALDSARDALDLAESSGERNHLPEVRRVHAEALAANGSDGADVGGQLRRAVGEARERGALFFELRAALSLAREEGRRGDGRASREALASAYARFADGFDLPDLVEARRVLDAHAS